MKNVLKSKTVQLAVIQGIGMIVLAVMTDLDLVAYMGIAKSVIDILLRVVTDTPVTLTRGTLE